MEDERVKNYFDSGDEGDFDFDEIDEPIRAINPYEEDDCIFAIFEDFRAYCDQNFLDIRIRPDDLATLV